MADTDNVTKTLNDTAQGASQVADSAKDYLPPKGFSKDDIAEMGGSLKIHLRLALDIDIRIIAKALVKTMNASGIQIAVNPYAGKCAYQTTVWVQ